MRTLIKATWFLCGWMIGMVSLSLSMGSVPKTSQITDDTALYQRISEIRVAKQGTPNFDSDIERLSRMESRYQESFLINGLLKKPMERVSAKKYRFTSKKTAASKRNKKSYRF